tara:strand:- start:113 stop:427 length:315 start_codon:yes stop_codon:yes gene_type:complete
MDVSLIISSILDNPIYLVLTIILVGLSVFALVKSLYKLFIILLCITLGYFFYLDINNDPDYEKAKKEVKEDFDSGRENIEPVFQKAKDKAQDILDERMNDDDTE